MEPSAIQIIWFGVSVGIAIAIVVSVAATTIIATVKVADWILGR